jgi:ubiquinone/menaquinone biosynthesis C-methylase UbiE
MAEIRNFTQPDKSPASFIDFLDFTDKHPGIHKIRTESARRASVSTGHKVLDLGCGIGGATFHLAEMIGPDGLAAGVDISSALLDVATQRATNRVAVEFRLGNATAIPYPDKFFDIVRSERVFLYLPDRLAAIREMMRVAKPGGRVCILDTDFDCMAIHSTNPSLTRKMISTVAASLPNPVSARELPTLAKRAGLKDIQTEVFAITTPYEFLGRAMSGTLRKAAEEGIVAASEVENWLSEQAALHASGEFLQIWMFVLVIGTV